MVYSQEHDAFLWIVSKKLAKGDFNFDHMFQWVLDHVDMPLDDIVEFMDWVHEERIEIEREFNDICVVPSEARFIVERDTITLDYPYRYLHKKMIHKFSIETDGTINKGQFKGWKIENFVDCDEKHVRNQFRAIHRDMICATISKWAYKTIDVRMKSPHSSQKLSILKDKYLKANGETEEPFREWMFNHNVQYQIIHKHPLTK